MNKELFIHRLQTLRKEKGLTQQALADLLHVSNKTISRWETGESYPDIELLPQLAKIYDISIDELLSDQEIKTFKDFKKEDLIRYLPFTLSILSVILFYLFKLLTIPTLLGLMIYFILNSYAFKTLYQYTDSSDTRIILPMNTLTFFFITNDAIFTLIQSLFGAYALSHPEFVFTFTSNLTMNYVGCYLIAFVCSYFYYQHYKPVQKNDEN